MKPARGTALRTHKVIVRFAKKGPGRPQNSCLDDRVAEVRKLLRTELSCQQIADQLGVSRNTLFYFIRRRRLCDLSARRHFISQQESVAKLVE